MQTDKIITLLNFYKDQTRWCKFHYCKTTSGVATLNFNRAHSFCLTGAISYLFPVKEGSILKRYLENYLTIFHDKYVEHKPVFHTLASFNDEIDYTTLLAFLNDALAANAGAHTMQLLSK